jgi:pilus assembly protein CpaE
VPPTGTYGAEMTGQGAVGFYNTPVSTAIVDKFSREARTLWDTARSRWNKPLVDSGVDRRVLESIAATPYKTGVVTFWSTKGGDGKTSLAVNLACGLSVIGGQKVLLIDNDMNLGRIHLHLNIPPGQNTILHLASDYLAAANTMDLKMLKRRTEQADRQLDSRTKVVESKLDVLFGIQDPEQATSDELKGKQGRTFMEALLDVARRAYDFVVVDSSSNTKLGTQIAALSRSDIIMFVNSSDRASVFPNRDTLTALVNKAGLDRSRFHLVLNRFDERDQVDPRQISNLLALPIMAVVHEDTSREMVAAVNNGKPFVLTHMRRTDKNQAAEKTMSGLLDMMEDVFPPMGKLIAERTGRKRTAARKN